MNNNYFRLILLFILMSALNSCQFSISKMSFKAKNNFPVSLSQSLYTNNSVLITKNDYEIIHHFNFKINRVAYLPHIFGIETDVSDDINQELEKLVKEYKGDGVVNLSISSRKKIYFFGIIINITGKEWEVNGDIIKIKKGV